MAYISRAPLLLCANRFCIRFHFIPSSYRSCPASTEEKEEEGSDMETCRSLRLREIINFTFFSWIWNRKWSSDVVCFLEGRYQPTVLFICTQVGGDGEVKTKFRISSNLVTRLCSEKFSRFYRISSFQFLIAGSRLRDLTIVQIGDHAVATCKISWELSEFDFIAISLCLHKVFSWWDVKFFERRRRKRAVHRKSTKHDEINTN